MRDLKNKLTLVTGGASGIGRAIALGLANEGAHVFLVDIDAEKNAKTAAEIQALGVQCVSRTCDVSDPAQIATVVDEVLSQWGALDILVNNAGVLYYGATDLMTDQQWQRLLKVNVNAPFEFTRLLLPTFLKQPEAHILNVASMYGLFATNRCTAYHLSKYAMVGFGESLRAEYGRSTLGVTTLCPGFVQTNLFTSMINSDGSGRMRKPPNWVCSSPETIAKRAINGIKRDRRLVLVSPLAHLIVNLQRLVPGLSDMLYRVGRRKKFRQKAAQLAAESQHRGSFESHSAKAA